MHYCHTTTLELSIIIGLLLCFCAFNTALYQLSYYISSGRLFAQKDGSHDKGENHVQLIHSHKLLIAVLHVRRTLNFVIN